MAKTTPKPPPVSAPAPEGAPSPAPAPTPEPQEHQMTASAEAPAVQDESTAHASEIVKAEPVELATVDDGVTLLHLVKLLPHKAKKLRRLQRPSDEQLEAARDGLSSESQARFDELLERMDPDKDGVETARQNFRPFQLKIRQGANKDDNRPALADVGSIYGSDGRLFTSPTKVQAAKNGVPMELYCVVLSIWEGRVLFAPRIDGKTVPLPDFGDANTNLPYCQSMDRQRGAPVKAAVEGIGVCATCPYLPWKVRGESNLCTNTVTAVVMLYTRNKDGSFTGFDGVYEIGFSKTSETAGKLMNSNTNKWKASTDHMFQVTAKEVKGKDNQGDYFIFDVEVVPGDDGKPLPTPAADVPMLKLFYAKVACDYYFPKLAYTYRAMDRLKGASGGEKSDVDAVERRALAAAAANSSDMRGDNV